VIPAARSVRSAGSASGVTITRPPVPVSSSVLSSPAATSDPACSTATCVQVASTSASRCEETITVAPLSCSSPMIRRTSRVPAGSRPLDGSSSTTSRRGISSAEASPRRCFMPSE
jgi:hypothetical protein